jgi:hypothetical protein
MVQDPTVAGAVSKILQRSEKQAEIEKLRETFVDLGILPQLENNNSQIIYGRRGTGKTHVFKVLASRLSEDPRNVAIFVDARTLGSTSQFSDTTLPMRRRCLALFRDVLGELENALLEKVVELGGDDSDAAFAALDQLAAAALEGAVSVEQQTVTLREKAASTSTRNAGASVSLKPAAAASVDLQSNKGKAMESESTSTSTVVAEDKILFPTLHASLARVLDVLKLRLYLLIDEWSSLPPDVQPYLAEFLKRGVLPVPRAVVKIASLEYRSRFLEHGAQSVGFEIGSDIATAPDLDDYYVFDRNPDKVTEAFADMLYRHLGSELPADYLHTTYAVDDAEGFAGGMFTERATLVELVRAAEGVVRDLINIFTRAFFDAQRRGRGSIDRRAIVDGARTWFEQDKSRNLDEKLQNVLQRIVSDVIGTRKARSFLLPRQLEQDPVVQKLFDARVLHHMQRGYADKDNPGVRYNIYSLDYGTYVDLRNTSKEPELGLVEHEEDAEHVVPFDDKRSIRRIVLGEEVLRG